MSAPTRSRSAREGRGRRRAVGGPVVGAAREEARPDRSISVGADPARRLGNWGPRPDPLPWASFRMFLTCATVVQTTAAISCESLPGRDPRARAVVLWPAATGGFLRSWASSSGVSGRPLG